jgi:hypothetical protein
MSSFSSGGVWGFLWVAKALVVVVFGFILLAGGTSERGVYGDTGSGAEGKPTVQSIVDAVHRRDASFENVSIETVARYVREKRDADGAPDGRPIGLPSEVRKHWFVRLGFAYKMRTLDVDPGNEKVRFDAVTSYDPVKGIARSLVHHSEIERWQASIDAKDDAIVAWDPYFRYIGGGRGEDLISLYEFLLANRKSISSIAPPDARGLVQVTTHVEHTPDDPEYNGSFWLDSANDLVLVQGEIERRFFDKDGSVFTVKDVYAVSGGFANVEGVLIPRKLRWWGKSPDNPAQGDMWLWEAELVAAHVKQAKASDLEVVFPANTDVFDKIVNVSYHNDDADRNATKQVNSAAIGGESALREHSGAQTQRAAGTESLLQSSSSALKNRTLASGGSWQWILCIGGALTLVGLVLLVAARRLRRPV